MKYLKKLLKKKMKLGGKECGGCLCRNKMKKNLYQLLKIINNLMM